MKQSRKILSLVLIIMLICSMNTLAAGVLQGDVNGDGAVSAVDAIYLLRHTVLPTNYPLNQSGDMNGDGSANGADAVYLLRHTIIPAQYPLKNGVTDCEHKEVIDEARTPTCTEDGLTEGKHCSECGFILLKQEIIPAPGHSYENGKCTVCGIAVQQSEGLAYTLSEDGTYYTVSGIGECKDSVVMIPAEYEGLPVKAIGKAAFQYNMQIQHVIISEGITEIGDSTFANCMQLQTVSMTDSVTKLGEHAFSYCYALQKITLSDQLTEIRNWTFYFCMNLTEINIPENLTAIGVYGFADCDKLQTISLPDSVETIGENAFSGCDVLTEIHLPTGLTEIANALFNECKSLTELQIPESVTKIGSSAFAQCAFETLTLPEGLQTICNDAFRDCANLKEIVFPKGLQTLGDAVLINCGSLEKVEIPEGVQELGNSFFKSCTSLKTVTLPKTLTRIGAWSFSGCSALETIIFAGTKGEWHTVIKDHIWDESTNDFDIIFLKQPTPAHDLAFTLSKDGTYYIVSGIGDCTEKDLVIPAFHNELPVLEIADNAFYGCHTLITLKLEDGIARIGNGAFRSCIYLISIELPPSITKIGESAFRSCMAISGVSLPNSLTALEDYVFADCTALETVSLPDGLISIGDEAFLRCYLIEKISLPASLQSIGVRSFKNCGLKALSLPEGLLNIDNEAFASNDFTEIVIPDSVKYIGGAAFSECRNLVNISLPIGITEIADSLFYNCTSLMSVIVPENVTSIGNRAFFNCQALTELVIPKSVHTLGATLFGNQSSTPVISDLSIVYNGTNSAWMLIKKADAWDAGAEYMLIFTEQNEDIKDIRNPASYSSTYAYNFLGKLAKGTKMQTLYTAMDVLATAFHLSDIDVPAEMEGVIGLLNYGTLGLDDDEAQAVWCAYYYDHPLYYWMAPYLAQMDGQLYFIVDEAYYSASVRNEYNEKIYQKVDEWVSLTANEISAYNITLAYHDLIISEINYAYKADGRTPEDAIWAHNILGVFGGGGKGVCESYAKTFQMMLNYSGVENVYVVGDAYGGHAWNMAKLDDGNWYWFDLTWDDDPSFAWGIRYNYFAVNNAQNVNWYYQDGGYIIDTNGDNRLDHTSFIHEHTPDPVTTTGMYFTYALPEISTTTFKGNLRETFTVDGLQYAISGYHTVQLTDISKTGYVQIPETVTYGGVTYTVTSIGAIRSDGIYSKYSITNLADSLYIPKTVKYIWTNAFADSADTTITVDSENPYYYSVDGDIYMRSLYIIRQNAKNVHIPKKQLKPAA
ncbi:MAG: leucine-rich repeat protein [Clostridia bacterium]|nr:leucine-rich repeat protein [Clostridia bacterium]